MQEAEQEWLLALESNERYALSHEALSVYYAQAGRFDESIAHIRHLIDIGAPVLPELMKIYEKYHK